MKSARGAEFTLPTSLSLSIKMLMRSPIYGNGATEQNTMGSVFVLILGTSCTVWFTLGKKQGELFSFLTCATNDLNMIINDIPWHTVVVCEIEMIAFWKLVSLSFRLSVASPLLSPEWQEVDVAHQVIVCLINLLQAPGGSGGHLQPVLKEVNYEMPIIWNDCYLFLHKEKQT